MVTPAVYGAVIEGVVAEVLRLPVLAEKDEGIHDVRLGVDPVTVSGAGMRLTGVHAPDRRTCSRVLMLGRVRSCRAHGRLPRQTSCLSGPEPDWPVRTCGWAHIWRYQPGACGWRYLQSAARLAGKHEGAGKLRGTAVLHIAVNPREHGSSVSEGRGWQLTAACVYVCPDWGSVVCWQQCLSCPVPR